MSLEVTGDGRYSMASSRGGLAFSPIVVSGVAGIIDFIAALASGASLFIVYVGLGSPIASAYGWVIVIEALLAVAAFRFVGLYSFEAILRPAEHFKRIATCLAIVFLLVVSLIFSLKSSDLFSRLWFYGNLVGSMAAITLGRILFRRILIDVAGRGWLARNVAVVGGGEQARRLLERIRQKAEPWTHIVGVFDDRLSRVGPSVAGYPVVGNVEDLISLTRQHRVDEVIVSLPWSAEARLNGLIKQFKELPVALRLSPDLIGFLAEHRGHSSFADVAMLDIASKPISGWRTPIKAVEDKAIASFALMFFLPLMALIAMFIRLESPGPALFRQKRYGFNNKVFVLYKFRTMHEQACAREAERTGSQEKLEQAKRRDPRVTRFGRFLRKTSLDELPQLFNVLKGDMSLVGPRPHAISHNLEYGRVIDGYSSRHRVKPGITGWAQVNGLRGETRTPEAMARRVEYDIEYIENWSLAFDLKILLRTVWVGFVNENAY